MDDNIPIKDNTPQANRLRIAQHMNTEGYEMVEAWLTSHPFDQQLPAWIATNGSPNRIRLQHYSKKVEDDRCNDDYDEKEYISILET